MRLFLKDDLPFIEIQVEYHGKNITIPNVLIDTGSASTILSIDAVSEIGIEPLAQDILHTIRGIDGTEVVFLRTVDTIRLDQQSLQNFEIEVGGMDYGFDMNGILGMDFLLGIGAILDLSQLQITFTPASS